MTDCTCGFVATVLAQTGHDCAVPELTFDPPLDEGIAKAVHLLLKNGFETFESCEGGEGHCQPGGVIRFSGDPTEGMRAVAALVRAGHNVTSLSRDWHVEGAELTGPWWRVDIRV